MAVSTYSRPSAFIFTLVAVLQLVRAVKGRYDWHDFNPHYG
jgi:hypothetical protein